jgi:hypothetical protein
LSDVNASALAPGLGLDDKCLNEPSFAGLDEVISDLGIVVGIEEGSGDEIVFFVELLFHFA